MNEVVSSVTEGIKITAKVAYRTGHSNPEKLYYLFSYRISIENKNNYSIRLLKRKWKVFDSSGEYYEEEGKGAGGVQVILGPNGVFEYDSVCSLNTDMGKMLGHFIVERIADNETLLVKIPVILLIAPYRMS